MRSKHFVRKTLNLILVATMSACLTFVRRAYLCADPLEDCLAAAAATYDGAIAQCLADLEAAQADWDAAVETYQVAMQDSETAWLADVAACQGSYDLGVQPCIAALDDATQFLIAEAWIAAALCYFFAAPPAVAACEATVALDLAIYLAIAYAAYLYCISPMWSAWSECSEIASAAMTARGLAAAAPKDAADAVWLAAQAIHSDCDAAAEAAYEADIIACFANNP